MMSRICLTIVYLYFATQTFTADLNCCAFTPLAVWWLWIWKLSCLRCYYLGASVVTCAGIGGLLSFKTPSQVALGTVPGVPFSASNHRSLEPCNEALALVNGVRTFQDERVEGRMTLNVGSIRGTLTDTPYILANVVLKSKSNVRHLCFSRESFRSTLKDI